MLVIVVAEAANFAAALRLRCVFVCLLSNVVVALAFNQTTNIQTYIQQQHTT